MTDLLNNLRHEITHYLKSNGLSPSAFEKKSGLKSGTLRNILYLNSKNPTLETLVKLSDVMNLSLDQLIYGSTDSFSLKTSPKTERDDLCLLFKILTFIWSNLPASPSKLETTLALTKKIYLYCHTYVEGQFDPAFARHALDDSQNSSSNL